MPRLLWLMFHMPISSPQMTRMFGFLASSGAARAGSAARQSSAAQSARWIGLKFMRQLSKYLRAGVLPRRSGIMRRRTRPRQCRERARPPKLAANQKAGAADRASLRIVRAARAAHSVFARLAAGPRLDRRRNAFQNVLLHLLVRRLQRRAGFHPALPAALSASGAERLQPRLGLAHRRIFGLHERGADLRFPRADATRPARLLGGAFALRRRAHSHPGGRFRRCRLDRCDPGAWRPFDRPRLCFWSDEGAWPLA